MKGQLPSMNLLVVFDRAAKLLSFKLAAEELCVTPSAVGHQIKVLEKELGVILFRRLNRAVELTDDGKAFHLAIKKPLAEIAHATAKAKVVNSQRPLHIHSIPFITNNLIVPNLKSFKKAQPALKITIESKIDRAAFDGSPIQVAIRHRLGEEPGLVYEELTEIKVSPICAKDYQLDGKALKADCQIRLTSDDESWATWSEQWGMDIEFTDTLHCDGFQAVMDMASQGLGIAMGYFPILSPHFDDSGLKVLFPDMLSEFSSLYLVYSERDKNEAAIQAFRVWFRGLLDNIAWI